MQAAGLGRWAVKWAGLALGLANRPARPGATTPDVALAKGAEENGLAIMLGDLVRQNLEAKPKKMADFDALAGRVSIVADDADVALTLVFERGYRHVRGEPSSARDHVRGEPSSARDHVRGEPSSARDHVRGEPSSARDHVRGEPSSPRAPRRGVGGRLTIHDGIVGIPDVTIRGPSEAIMALSNMPLATPLGLPLPSPGDAEAIKTVREVASAMRAGKLHFYGMVLHLPLVMKLTRVMSVNG
jgi:hypothetical protein